jgi:hypothetical protein
VPRGPRPAAFSFIGAGRPSLGGCHLTPSAYSPKRSAGVLAGRQRAMPRRPPGFGRPNGKRHNNGQPPAPPDPDVTGDDMPWYRVNRKIPAKRYIPFRRPDGSCHAGELMGRERVSADSSPACPVRRPAGAVMGAGRGAGCAGAGTAPADALPPRHFRTTDQPRGGVLALGRQLLFANDDVRISVVTVGDIQGLYCNFTGAKTTYRRNGSLRPAPVSRWPELAYGSPELGCCRLFLAAPRLVWRMRSDGERQLPG